MRESPFEGTAASSRVRVRAERCSPARPRPADSKRRPALSSAVHAAPRDDQCGLLRAGVCATVVERIPIEVFGLARARRDDRPAAELQADDRSAICCAAGPRAELYGSPALRTSGILDVAWVAVAASLLACRVALSAWVVCLLGPLYRVPELARSCPLQWGARGDVLSGRRGQSAHSPCATVVG